MLLASGFDTRLVSELKSKMPTTDFTVIAPSNRAGLVWKGGSRMASKEFFQDMLTTKKSYREHGSLTTSKRT